MKQLRVPRPDDQGNRFALYHFLQQLVDGARPGSALASQAAIVLPYRLREKRKRTAIIVHHPSHGKDILCFHEDGTTYAKKRGRWTLLAGGRTAGARRLVDILTAETERLALNLCRRARELRKMRRALN